MMYRYSILSIISFMTMMVLLQIMMILTSTTIPTVCYGYMILHQQQTPIRNVYHSLKPQQQQRIVSIVTSTTSTTTRVTTKLYSTSTTASSSSNGMIYTLDGQEIRQKVTAMNNILFVKVKESISTTTGGIVLPDQSKIRPTEGIVIASGPGKIHPYTGKRISNPIPIGMSVLYGQYDGKSVTYNDEECQIIRDDNVLLAYNGTIMTLDNVIPIRDYVLIELLLPNEISNYNNNNNNNDDDNTILDTSSSSNTIATNSGIVLAASVMKENLICEGRVIKIGEGRMNSYGTGFTKSPVQINDIVKFKEYAGNDIFIDGKQYSVVKMVDILCTYIL